MSLMKDENYCRCVKDFYSQGYSSKEITAAVGVSLGIWRSIRTTQRYLNQMGLVTKSKEHPLPVIVSNVKSVLDKEHGANAIYKILRMERKILVKRQTVRDVVEAIQPGRAAALRKTALKRRVYSVKGPNHIWHADGNDKLVPFSFGIHGCIDGYSRKLIWLELLPSNKNPSKVVKIYLKTIEDLNLIPQVLRVDKGTENFIMGDYQTLLSDSLASDDTNFIGTLYGSSNHNQRIEQFWAYLKKVLLISYSSIFKDLQDCGLLTKDAVERRCLYFCFEHVLKKDLEEVKQRWNSHRVRRNYASDLPAGVPNFLYSMPQYFNNEERGRKFKKDVLKHLKEINSKDTSDDMVNLEDFEEWALEVMLCNNWTVPTDKDAAIDLYGKLLSKLRQ